MYFFAAGNDPCNVLDGARGIFFIQNSDVRAAREAVVLLATDADVPKALQRHRAAIGNECIELSRATMDDVQQVGMNGGTERIVVLLECPLQLYFVYNAFLLRHFHSCRYCRNCRSRRR